MNLQRTRGLNILALLILGLIFLVLPLIYTASHLDPLLVPRMICLIVICMLLILYLHLTQAKVMAYLNFVFKNKILLSYTILIIACVVSVNYSRNASEGLLEFFRILLYYVFTVLSGMFFIEKHNREQAIKMAQLLGPCLMIISLYQFIYMDTVLRDDINVLNFYGWFGAIGVEAIFGNGNLFSFACLLLLPFSIVLFLSDKTKLWRWASGLNILFYLLIIVYLHTVSALLILPIVTVILLVLHYKVLRQWSKKKSLVLGISLGALLLIGVLQKEQMINIRDQITGIIEFDTSKEIHKLSASSNVFERSIMLKNSFSLIRDNWLMGVGLGDWKIDYQQYGIGGATTLNHDHQKFQRPHNDYLHVFSEAGLMGFLAFLAIIVFTIWAAFKLVVKAEDLLMRYLGLGILFGVLSYAMISLFSYPKERIFLSTVFHIFIALIIGLTYHEKETIESKKYVFPVWIIIIGLLFGSGYWLVNRFNCEKLLLQGYYHKLNSRWLPLQTKINKAKSSTFLTLDPTGTPLDWYLGMASLNLGNLKSALNHFLAAEKRNPYHVTLLNDIGGCYFHMNNIAMAKMYYHKALTITPLYENTLINLAAIKYKEGKIDDAYSQISTTKDCPQHILLPILRKYIVVRARESGNKLIILKVEDLIKSDGHMNEYFSICQKSKTNFYDVVIERYELR